MVVLTWPRQVGKTTLTRQLIQLFWNAQYLDWDVLPNRSLLQKQPWNPCAKLLVMDESRNGIRITDAAIGLMGFSA